jgi:hypothetical protein
MSKRINSKDQLPAWFCLDDYQKLLSLSDSEILLQLLHRRDTYNDKDAFIPNDSINYVDEILSCGEVIKEGDEHYYAYTDNEFSKVYSDLQLKGMGAVKPLDLITLNHLYKSFQEYVSEHNIKRSLRGQKRSVTGTIGDAGEMHLNINLDWPDELIIKDLEILLPLWRKSLSNPDETRIFLSQSWDVIKKKIFDYNVFPFIDLMTWANWSDITITRGVLSVALYPDGRYDYTNIAQTIKPFVENLI